MNFLLLGTDLFHFNGVNYLVIADYYSEFALVTKIPIHFTAQSVVDNARNPSKGGE